MKKWKAFLLRLPVYLALVAVVGVGIWNWWKQFGLPEQLVKNILSIGDTFAFQTFGNICRIDKK